MTLPAQSARIHTLTPESGARVRIISDIHYGHVRSLAPSPRDLVAMMAGVDVLVIAGDFAETRPTHAYREKGVKLREQARKLCSEAGIQLIELAGNHDTDTEPMMLRLWDGDTIVVHGHMFFDEVAPWGWEYLSNRASSDALIASFPQRHHNIDEKLALAQAMSLQHTPAHQSAYQTSFPLLNKLLHCFWPPQRPYQILRAWMTAAQRAEQFAQQFAPDCQHVVFGHFHRCGAWQKGTRRLYCTGAWFKHAHAAAVDMIDNKVVRYAPIPIAKEKP